jgi:hypothetical protein
LVELEDLGHVGDRQELVHGDRFCPGLGRMARSRRALAGDHRHLVLLT